MTTVTRPRQDAESNAAASLGRETLRKWLYDMELIREFEIRTSQSYEQKKIGGFCHVYIGQEAVAVGCTAAVNPDDPIVTAYRDHGHALARGMEPKYAMAEMYGKITGCAKGKGGSMHFFDRDNELYGGHGIVSAQTPLGAGLAFATKYEDEVLKGIKNSKVTLCFLGDGALNQGALHEAMNLAGLFDLPVIFCVENNGYSMGTSITRGTTMGDNITVKAAGYGMDSAVIEAMDVMDVYNGMKPVVDKCRAESRPAFVDLRTYRFKGHSMSDPRKYRTKEEEKQFEALDPLDALADFMRDHHDFSDDDRKAMKKEIKTIVRDSITFAEESPVPPLSELHTDVYVEEWGPYTGTSLPQMLTDRKGNG